MKETAGMEKNKITKKIYYRITFRLASALSVGSGENQCSDNDIVRDSAGAPFVPGSSLAGIYRSFLSPKDAEDYFGTARNGEDGAGSKVLVYDARLRNVEGKLSYRSVIRDCVGLDEWKTGKAECKFDFEVVEPGAEFVTYLEQNCGEKDRDICEELADAWMRHEICIGRKTMRGLGSIDAAKVCRRSFDLTRKEELDKWLDFDMYRDEDWKDAELTGQNTKKHNSGKSIVLEMELQQKGGISIRRYTTAEGQEDAQPDAEQMTCILARNGEDTEVPCIPGTSWAGAFRHHMERLVPGCTEEYFGSCEKRSEIRFFESFLEGARPKVLTRNAVDRFTGGVVKNALFTEKMWYGGKTLLRIEIPAGTEERFKQALAAALTDLHMGVLSVGGLTAVGRGIFEGGKLWIDGEAVPVSDKMYGEILKKLEGR